MMLIFAFFAICAVLSFIDRGRAGYHYPAPPPVNVHVTVVNQAPAQPQAQANYTEDNWLRR